MVIVRSRMPGHVAMTWCSPANLTHSYGSSVITQTSCLMHNSAIIVISARVITRPVGLCGVLRTSAFVRFVNAFFRRSGSIVQCGRSSGTKVGIAPARIASGP